jgi:hypothetical protein
MFSSSGQNSAYLFFRIEFCIKVDIELYIIKPNGSGLCWRATCQG